eukprot:CAMPEP_0178432656 /NCGR_PEP_ID=MMETSP0689_2-20121128/32501_1 /TAXON_ID=160604 /ORGANISM="Amphidinium massartii, Strain CS-259" /LENGTH=199 /DNA_ID=CAMNT_0020054657 /DNA_START=73 /DNA_END=669 /DNA_ORIENTATION=-
MKMRTLATASLVACLFQTATALSLQSSAHKRQQQQQLRRWQTSGGRRDGEVQAEHSGSAARTVPFLHVNNATAQAQAPPSPTYPLPQLPEDYPCRFSVCVPGVTHPGRLPQVVTPTFKVPKMPDGLSSDAVVPLGPMPEKPPLPGSGPVEVVRPLVPAPAPAPVVVPEAPNFTFFTPPPQGALNGTQPTFAPAGGNATV